MDFVILCTMFVTVYIVYVIKLSNDCKKKHKRDIYKYKK